MVKNRSVVSLAAVLALACFSFGASATPMTNYAPGTLLDDIDGTGYFSPDDAIFSIELLDYFESFALPGSEFGFFFQGADVSDTNNLHTIFSSADATGDEAWIDLVAGHVVDIEEIAIESTFAGAGNLGFYLSLTAVGVTIFSDSLLNAGVDYFGAFPFISNPDYLALTFVAPPGYDLLSIHLATGLTPVPEPPITLLMLLGLIGLATFRRSASSAVAI